MLREVFTSLWKPTKFRQWPHFGTDYWRCPSSQPGRDFGGSRRYSRYTFLATRVRDILSPKKATHKPTREDTRWSQRELGRGQTAKIWPDATQSRWPLWVCKAPRDSDQRQETDQHRQHTDPCSPTAVTLTQQTRTPASEPTVKHSICVFSLRKETSNHKRIRKDSQ